jgi:hypothetical protein
VTRELHSLGRAASLGSWIFLLCALTASGQQTYDVVVYGGTAAGVISAVSAAHEGMSVALLEPGTHLGGMASGGLSATDYGDRRVIGGYAFEFYQRVGRHYDIERYGEDAAWYYEPHVGEQVFLEMAKEAGVKVFLNQLLRETDGVLKESARITTIYMENGSSFRARVYVDSSYEGDLMAKAGVSYTLGRESSSQYGESLAGVRAQSPGHQWLLKISPYGKDGILLPEVWPDPPGTPGTADRKLEAYNFRVCLTKDSANQIPFPKPEHYDSKEYELLARLLTASTKQSGRPPRLDEVLRMVKVPNEKVDVNNNGAFSTDYIGRSWDYPEAHYRRRAEIWQQHLSYIRGLLYFLAHDPRVPTELQREVNSWGLPRDEFADTDHWPDQLYIREARRMTGGFVMTQKDLQTDRHKYDAIGMGSYSIDSHNTYRYVTADGSVANEGDMQIAVRPYEIPYRVLLPKRMETENLLVVVCVSASHVAYSSLRMEPQYMIMGQAAGIAASLAVREGAAVQDIDIRRLTDKIRKTGGVLNENE